MLRLVDDTMRTSTATLVEPPTRWKVWSTSTPQDLVLGVARHVGDFVDEQRAAVRLLQRTHFALLRAVALLDAEQLDLHALPA